MDIAKIKHRIEKTRQFYSTGANGCALIKVKSIATQPVAALPLTRYDFPKDMYRYMDDRAGRYIEQMRLREDVEDDTIPAEGPWYGIAEHSAFLGGWVEYGDDTSWHHIEMNSPGELEKLSMDENNEIFRMVTGGIAYMRDKYPDNFLPMVRGASGALEMANTLRGNDLFYDFYEEPEELKRLLNYCADALDWYYKKQMEAAGDVFGGVVTGFGEWLPGRGLGHISEDTTTMISLEQFEEFGRPRTERLCQKYDIVFLHAHALSERCLASIAALPHLVLMELSSDPNTDRAVQVWRRNRHQLGGVIPVLCLSRDEIAENMDMLKEQKTVVWYDATSVEDAQDICRLFERELPVR